MFWEKKGDQMTMGAKFEKPISTWSLYLMVVDLNPHNTMHLFLGEQIYRLPSFCLWEMKEHEGQKLQLDYGIDMHEGVLLIISWLLFCFDILEFSMRILQRPCHKVDRVSLNEFFCFGKWYYVYAKVVQSDSG